MLPAIIVNSTQMKLILESFWFLLPAIVANNVPVILAEFHLFEFLKIPLSQKYLGENKTWRGFIFGIFLGIVTAYLQWQFSAENYLETISLFHYQTQGLIRTLILGCLQSFGILSFDLLKSFLKRSLKKPAGTPWPPFDQMDFLGGLFLSFFLIIPPLPHLLIILIGGPIIHALTNLISFKIGIKKVWY